MIFSLGNNLFAQERVNKSKINETSLEIFEFHPNEIKQLVDDYYLVKYEGKWGIVNQNNEIIFPIVADEIKYLWMEKFRRPRFSIDGVKYLINRDTKSLIKLELQEKVYRGIQEYPIFFNEECTGSFFERYKCENIFIVNKIFDDLGKRVEFNELVVEFTITKDKEIKDIMFNKVIGEEVSKLLKDSIVGLRVLNAPKLNEDEFVNLTYSFKFK